MIAKTLDGHLGTSVTIDLCTACQVFWFDARESLQLSPGAVIELFQLVGEGALERQAAGGGRTTPPRCPQCRVALLLTHDRQRNTPFQYLQVSARPRPADVVRRFSPREGLHHAALREAGRRPAAQRQNRQLLQLRRADRSQPDRVVHALRIAAVDAGSRTDRCDRQPAARGRRAARSRGSRRASHGTGTRTTGSRCGVRRVRSASGLVQRGLVRRADWRGPQLTGAMAQGHTGS